MIAEGVQYLEELIRPIDPSYVVKAFKPGSWGLQPSGGILSDLDAAGIRVVIGGGRGIRYQSEHFHADYSQLDEDLLPYHPCYEDVLRVSPRERPIVVLPLPYYRLPPGRLVAQVVRRILPPGRTSRAGRLYYQAPEAVEAARRSPMGRRRVSVKELLRQRGDVRSLDVGNVGFRQLKLAIDQIMSRCVESGRANLPLVIQSHTKAYAGNWKHISDFFHYFVKEYGALLEFATLGEVADRLPSMVSTENA